MRPATEEYGLVRTAGGPAADCVVAASVAVSTAASSGQMLTRLALVDFRNYGELDLRLMGLSRPCPIVLAGPNGAGKTNLLEAISYLAPGRGIKGARLGDLTRLGADGSWSVSARLQTAAGEIEVGTGVQKTAGKRTDETEGGGNSTDVEETLSERLPERLPERRMVRIDGSPSRPASLARIATILWLTPRMDRLFVEGSSARRRFLDRLVLGLHVGHGREIAAYERAMRERLNLLTRHGVDGGDPDWLTALERQMAEHGVAVAAGRIDAIGHLTEQIVNQPAGAFPKATLALHGILETGLQTAAALQVEEDFAGKLARNRAADARSGRTSEGPHRSDMLATHMAKGLAANLCSTGEQKALLVGLLLANAAMLKTREDRAPILLLDEIAAHLDEAHRRALFDSLLDLQCQTWLTGTDMALFEPLGGGTVRLSVQDGQIFEAA